MIVKADLNVLAGLIVLESSSAVPPFGGTVPNSSDFINDSFPASE